MFFVLPRLLEIRHALSDFVSSYMFPATAENKVARVI